VEVVVPAQLFGTIGAGSWLNVLPELPNARPRPAKVVLVDALIDGPSNTFRARLELPNANYEVPAGLRCKVELGAGSAQPASTEPVPVKAAPGLRLERSIPTVKSGGDS
jgi:hypothetical protein